MKATVIKEFPGAPDGAIYPKTFVPGDVVEGDLARVAVENGWAKEGTQDATKKPADGGLVAIPDGWEKLNAADTVALAQKLGAGDDVKTKAVAVDFIKDEIAKRDAQG